MAKPVYNTMDYGKKATPNLRSHAEKLKTGKRVQNPQAPPMLPH